MFGDTRSWMNSGVMDSGEHYLPTSKRSPDHPASSEPVRWLGPRLS
jgi:hypothetical protein